MNIKEKVLPLPTKEYLHEMEDDWELALPEKYKDFLLNYNGGIPIEQCFSIYGHEYMIERFLSILSDYKDNSLGDYDITVTESQLCERLTDDPNSTGLQKLPIAVLFAGDFLCLDYKESTNHPSVCVWYHDASYEFRPAIKKIADSFEQFIEMLYSRL